MIATTEPTMSVIASTGMGWKSADQALASASPARCHACRHFEMRMIKAKKTDCFGHLWPTCNHPILPGKSGQPTQSTATCNHWETRR